MSGTAVTTVRAGLFAALGTLFPAPTLVIYGPPGEDQENEIVAVMGSKTPITRPTMGTSRSREEITETEIVFDVYQGGGPEVMQTVTERAYAMAGQLGDYLATSPQERLGSVVSTPYDSWVSDLEDTVSIAYNAQSGAATGRRCELRATVTSKSRPRM